MKQFLSVALILLALSSCDDISNSESRETADTNVTVKPKDNLQQTAQPESTPTNTMADTATTDTSRYPRHSQGNDPVNQNKKGY